VAIIDKIFQIIVTILIGIVSATIVLYASQAMASTASDSEIKSYIETISTKLEPEVVALKHDVRLYHWFRVKSGTFENVTVRNAFFQRYSKVGMSAFWRSKDHQNPKYFYGIGLYAAIDPFSSQSWGNAVLEITVKKGSRILPTGNSWTGLLLEHLSKIAPRVYAMDADDITKISKGVYEKLQIVGVTYYFVSAVKPTVCSSAEPVAFILSGLLDRKTGLASSEGIEVIALVPRNSRESDEAKAAYRRVGAYYASQESAIFFEKLVAPSENAALKPDEKQELREHIFSCDRKEGLQ
jgi:hypothetical protein